MCILDRSGLFMSVIFLKRDHPKIWPNGHIIIVSIQIVFEIYTYVQILDTWTHHQNLSGYLPMNMNKF